MLTTPLAHRAPAHRAPAHRTLNLRSLTLRAAAISAISIVAVAASQAAATAAPAAEPGAHYDVTIVAPPRAPHVGTPFDITGSVAPGAPGDEVDLQRQVGGSFQTIATGALDSGGDYSFSRTYQAAGPYVFRVLKPAGGGYDRGASPAARVWVTGDTLFSGRVMQSGDLLFSHSGMYRLWMRPNGNLELDVTATGRYLWSSRTGGHPGAWSMLRRDGDLVVHAADGRVLNDTQTAGNPDGSYSLEVAPDGELLIDAPDGTFVWSSDSVNDTLFTDETLLPGQFITSPSGRYEALMQDDGTFVVYDTSQKTAIWDSYTAVPNSTVTMQPDGNLMLRGPLGKPLWSSRTSGHTGAHAVMQDDGNLVIFQSGKAVWGSDGVNGVLGDDYPTALRDATKDSLVDPWRFYNRECVSFVAWRLNHANHFPLTNFLDGGHFGNANTWDDNARKLGYTVNNVPARGAVAQTDAGSYGHVAWVAAVGNGTVTIEDYNYSAPGEYGVRTVPTSSYVYIHFKDLQPPK